MTKSFFILISLLIILLLNGPSALAKWGTFTMTDANGDEVVVKHGLFGKKTIVKDRYGDGFEHSRSIFGLTKDTQVGVLGNEVHSHKGLFGFGKTEGQDMLGDTVSSHNNLLYRNTNIDMNGANNFLNKLFAPKNQPPSYSIPSGQPGPSGHPGTFPRIPTGNNYNPQTIPQIPPQGMSQAAQQADPNADTAPGSLTPFSQNSNY